MINIRSAQKSDILLPGKLGALFLAIHPVFVLKTSIPITLKPLSRAGRVFALMLLFYLAADVSLAQSIDISSPSPIRRNEVVGKIAARDLGDSRLTDHFYTFKGTPGDVLITVKSNNLNGDVDLFTAGSLRPLMKFTLYAEDSTPISRALFLRKREDLILRVEARSPNDDEGVYQITLGGSFEAIVGDDPVAEPLSPTSDSGLTDTSRGTGSRRVSSVGARIAEPPVVREEIAVAPTPQPTPEDVAVPTVTPEPTATKEAPARASTPGRTRGRVPASRRKPTPQPTGKTERSGSETTSEPESSEATPNADRPAPTTRRTGRRGATSRSTEPAPAQEPLTGPRLVIEMHDGTRVERFMSTIRRVTVENNQIVVVRKDGVIEKTRMPEVLRMAIEP